MCKDWFLRSRNQINHFSEATNTLALFLFHVLKLILQFKNQKLNFIDSLKLKIHEYSPLKDPYLLLSLSKPPEQLGFLLLLKRLSMVQHSHNGTLPSVVCPMLVNIKHMKRDHVIRKKLEVAK